MPTAAEQPPGRRPWTRRRLLAAAALAPLGLGGCAAGDRVGEALGVDLDRVRRDDVPLPEPPVPGPDDDARVLAVRTATELSAAATAVAGVRPDLAALLTAVAADHAAHLVQLGPLPDAETSGAPSAAPSAAPSETAPPTTPSPAAVDPALLPAGESTAAAELLAELGAVSGPLARLLTAVAASRAVHAADLAGALALPAPTAPLTPFGAGGTLDSPVPAAVRVTAGSTAGPAGDALLDLVAAEHAAGYAYGVLAVRLSDEARRSALDAIGRHRRAADRAAALAVQLGLAPAPAEVAYATPDLPDAAAAAALAADLELGLARSASVVVARADGDLRSLAADLLVARTLAARGWRTPLPALPGLAELDG